MNTEQNLFIMITEAQLREIISTAVKAAVEKLGANSVPEFSTPEALAARIMTSKDRSISPITIRKWSILKPARREINGKIFYNTKQALDAIDQQR